MSHSTGQAIWLTGLSAAGKTTIANALSERLSAEGRRVEVLDGAIGATVKMLIPASAGTDVPTPL